ncbi:MAG: phosphodiester glycosidase family protein [Ignavibacteria bacterium]|nr:phosphodiester glycosidase family protein [Ignavibacteria bacterium]
MGVWFRKKIIFLLIFSLFLSLEFGVEAHSGKKKSKPSISKKSKLSRASASKHITKSKIKKKRKKKPRLVVPKVLLNQMKILDSQELSKGVFYKQIQFGTDELRILVHLIEVDIDSTPYQVRLLKAKNTVDGLDYIRNIYDDFQFELTRIYGGDLIAISNANFWSAFMNYPIGIFVTEGEVISMKKYKEWSTVFFDEENRPYIDNFELFGEIILPDGHRVRIDNVNRRSETDVLVLYNKYFGDTIPKVHIKDLEKLVDETISAIIQNSDFTDTTEIEIDTNEIRNQIINSKKEESKEFSTRKLVFRYLEQPAINRKILVEFLGYDSSVVKIPSNGFIFTLPAEKGNLLKLKRGEKCYLYFSTDRLRYIKFTNAVSGTPRLVRKGVAKHEAYQEGSRGFRFIGAQLPRTAIGTNMSKTKIFLFVAEASKTNRSLGANLSQLSIIAKKIGCFDAMNLDGGGSSIMLVNGKKVGSNGESNGRRISGAIGISVRNKK